MVTQRMSGGDVDYKSATVAGTLGVAGDVGTGRFLKFTGMDAHGVDTMLQLSYFGTGTLQGLGKQNGRALMSSAALGSVPGVFQGWIDD